MIADILMLGGGLICAYWALGAISMIFKAMFGGHESKKEFNESKGLIIIGGFLATLLALWLIPASCESLFGEDEVEDSYNISFQGSDKRYVETHYECKRCSCDGYHGYKHSNGAYEGDCMNTDKWGHSCGCSPEAHGLKRWRN